MHSLTFQSRTLFHLWTKNSFLETNETLKYTFSTTQPIDINTRNLYIRILVLEQEDVKKLSLCEVEAIPKNM